MDTESKNDNRENGYFENLTPSTPEELLKKAMCWYEANLNHYGNISDYAKVCKKKCGVDPSTTKKIKDYVYRTGKAWVNNNPLEIDTTEPIKDKVSQLLVKFMDIIANLGEVGMIDFLEPYLKAMEGCGVKIEIDKSKFKYVVQGKELFDKNIACMIDEQNFIDKRKEEFDNVFAPMAETLGISPKSKFKEYLRLRYLKDNGKSYEDKVDKQIDFIELYEKGLRDIIES